MGLKADDDLEFKGVYKEFRLCVYIYIYIYIIILLLLLLLIIIIIIIITVKIMIIILATIVIIKNNDSSLGVRERFSQRNESQRILGVSWGS